MPVDGRDAWLSDGDLRITVIPGPDASVCLHLAGDLDMVTDGRLALVLDGVLGTHGGRIEIDVTDIRFVDSSGLRVLLSATERIAPDLVILRGPTPSLRNILEVAGVSDRFAIEDHPPTP